jgi:hypothetical protein
MATITNRHKTYVIIIAVAALAAVLVVAGTAASVGSDHMAFASRKKPSTTFARSSTTTTTSHPSNSGIIVLNKSDQRNLKCSTAGEGSAITGSSCTNAAASATDVSGGVTGSSSSGGNSGIKVLNKSDQSGLTCSTAGSTAPIDTASCANSASSGTTVSGGVAH